MKHMKINQKEKYEIIRLVEQSDTSAKKTLSEIGVPKSTFYDWYGLYLEKGFDGLADKKRKPKQVWNQIPQMEIDRVIKTAELNPTLSSRELACRITDNDKSFISESSVYRILKANGMITAPAYILMSASDEFKDKTTRINEMWQTDFTYFKVFGWGQYYLSTILDDYSRYIVAHELCTSMKPEDTERTVDLALLVSGVPPSHRPKLLSDNGPCYISNELKEFLKKRKMKHVRGRPCHPQTQGKIERYHRTMKNVVKLDIYYSPEELKAAIREFVEYYNNKRYHESLNDVTPADVYFGRKEMILKKRREIKQKTIAIRRHEYFKQKNSNFIKDHLKQCYKKSEMV
jgi:transposase InsO family protein